MKLPLFLTLALTSPAFASGWVPLENAIIHGKPEVNSAISHSAVLLAPADGVREYCSGVLLTNDLVVTAAHCVVKGNTNNVIKPQQILVNFSSYYDGESSLSSQPIVHVQAIRKHPLYDNDEADNSGSPHDVALIRLAAPALPGYVPAMFLPRSRPLEIGMPVIVGGYGDTAYKRDDSDFRLRSFEFQVAKFRLPTTLVELHGHGPGGVGNGDSGGPAFAVIEGRLYLWGVLSSGENNGSPAYYENLNSYRNWLEESARSMGTTLTLP